MNKFINELINKKINKLNELYTNNDNDEIFNKKVKCKTFIKYFSNIDNLIECLIHLKKYHNTRKITFELIFEYYFNDLNNIYD